MTRITLTITDQVAAQLDEMARHDLESAGVLIAGLSRTEDEIRLLGRQFIAAPQECYLERSSTRLRLGSAAWMPALKRAGLIGAEVALFVHTHPDAEPNPSIDDDVVDEQLRPVFQTRLGKPLYGSIVLHRTGAGLEFSGRVWEGLSQLGPIELVRQVGRRLVFTSAIDSPSPAPPSAIFDRQVRAFGPAFQQLFEKLHIGIVGAGGTGSAVGEQLARLGVGRITIIDDETVDATNITRIYGSGLGDVGRPKVDVFRDSAARIGLGTQVRQIKDRITSLAAAKALRSCDVVFGCTDDLRGRAILCRLAYWYLIPVVDVGFLIDSVGGVVRGLEGRVTTMLPGTACLQCLKVIDPIRLTTEQLPEQEREARIAEGYAPELEHRDPAVVTYTTVVASLAINELIERIVGFGDRAPFELHVRAHERKISTSSTPPDPQHFCAQAERWGAGDEAPFLGRSLWD
jgi:molybdopterin/thiamine biosynthesis adenylyltransferase